MINNNNKNTNRNNANNNRNVNKTNNNPETVAKEYMRKWLESFRYEQDSSTSLVLYLQNH